MADSLQDQLKALGVELKVDLVLNHLSVRSPQFQDLLEKGDESDYRDFFIDWDEFWKVVKGDGPMNRERLEHKRTYWEDGAWVREAAEAYAAKHADQPRRVA